MNANAQVNRLIYELALGTDREACLLDRILAVEKALCMESVESIGLLGRIFACKMFYRFLQLEKGLVGLSRGQTLAARIAKLERQLGESPPADFSTYFCYRIEHLERAVDKLYGK